MRNGMVGAIVLGAFLVAGAAVAQTAGPTAGPVLSGIVPVTGPSVISSLPEPPKPSVAPSSAPVAVGKSETGKVGGARPGAVSRSATTGTAAREMKAVHKGGTKATVKKRSAAKPVATAGARPGKTKRVAVAKRQAPVHHATVSKPMPLTKHQVPAKGAAPVPPVLPRV